MSVYVSHISEKLTTLLKNILVVFKVAGLTWKKREEKKKIRTTNSKGS